MAKAPKLFLFVAGKLGLSPFSHHRVLILPSQPNAIDIPSSEEVVIPIDREHEIRTTYDRVRDLTRHYKFGP